MVQTQSPDARRTEYVSELLEINKCLLKRWHGMEVVDYRISLDYRACGASANWSCLKRGHCLDVPHTMLVQRGNRSAVTMGRPYFYPTILRVNMAHETWLPSVYLGFILLPLTSNWFWLLHTWWLADLFLRSLRDEPLLSKIKLFSRPS